MARRICAAWLGDGSEVLVLDRGKGAAQVAGWMARGPDNRRGIPEHLAPVAERAVGRFKRSAVFNLADRPQQLGRSNVSDRPGPEMREDVALESADDPASVRVDPGGRMLCVPFPRAELEAVGGLHLANRLLRLPAVAWVDAVGERLSHASRTPTSGYVPNDSNFSLPSERYLRRHRLPPAGVRRRKRPRSSKSLVGLAPGFVLPMVVSVRAIGGVSPEWASELPRGVTSTTVGCRYPT